MRTACWMACCLLLGTLLGFGQEQFEVVSIRPAHTDASFGLISGGPGTKDPGRLTYSKVSLKGLIADAYPEYGGRISGPSQLKSEYILAATLPKGATKEQVRHMLANCLAERFGLRFHTETRRHISAYELTVAKGGSKLPPTCNQQLTERGSL